MTGRRHRRSRERHLGDRRWVGIHERRASFAGTLTRVLYNEGGGPVTFLLLHGFSDSADTWRLVLSELHAKRIAAVALDLPGFGEAAPLRSGAGFAELDAFVAAAVEWTEHEHGSPVVVVGNSLGGCLALRAAVASSGGVAGVVPIGPAGPDMAPWLLRLADVGGSPERMLEFSWPHVLRDWALAATYRRVAAANPIDRELVRRYVAYNRAPDALRRAVRLARALHPEILDPVDAARIRAPLRVIWGRRDRLCNVTGAHRLARAAPDGRAYLLDGVGHLPQLEAPERVADLLNDLAEEVGPGPSLAR